MLVWAGAVKIVEPLASVQAVKAYQIVDWRVAEWIGYTLPTVEIVVGAALILGILTRGAAVVASALFVVFVIGIISVWVRGIEIDCGCFGGGGSRAGAASQYPVEIARDLGLLGLSLMIVWLGPGRLALDNWLFRRADDDQGPLLQTEDAATASEKEW